MAPPASPPTPAPTSARWRRSVASPPLSRPATTPMPAPISAALRVRLGSSGALVWRVYVAQVLSRSVAESGVEITTVEGAHRESSSLAVRAKVGRQKQHAPERQSEHT